MMRALAIFGAAALVSGGIVALLASRSKDRLMAQAALAQQQLQAQMQGRGTTSAAYFQAQGDRAATELRAMAERLGADAAARQAQTTLAAYGITPQVLTDVQRAVTALRG